MARSRPYAALGKKFCGWGRCDPVAMRITGHETAEIFRRYCIVDTCDQLEALRAKEALVTAEKSNVARMPKR